MNKKIMIVGGFVRDLLLGEKSKDMDFLVTGWSVEEFLHKFPEAQQIGKDFPVMLYDECEFAFARKERNIGPKHTDFEIISDTSITIEEDLERRDLTINTFAMCPETGNIIASKNAFSDLENKILRHTSEAFKEDPLRVFRLARFSAKFPEFKIAQETIALCQTMKEEIKHLPKERVLNEMLLSFKTKKPSNFFRTLKEINCLEFWFKELFDCIGIPCGPEKYHGKIDVFEHLMQSLDKCRELTTDINCLFSILVHDLGKQASPSENWPHHYGHEYSGISFVQSFCERFNIGNNMKKSALIFCEEHMKLKTIFVMKPKKIVDFFVRISKFPGKIDLFLICGKCDGNTENLTLDVVNDLKFMYNEVMNVKLPVEHQNKGAQSGEILRRLRIARLIEIKKGE